MEIQERIKTLGNYFVNFNIAEGVAYVLVKFPNSWSLPDANLLKDEYKVKMTPKNKDGVYFFNNLSDGTDILFDAVDYVITFNKSIEERLNLFNTKIQELKEIFASQELEALRTLKFTIDNKAIKPTAEKKAKTEKKKTTPKKAPTKKVETPKVTLPIKNNETEDSNMMALVKEMVDE